MLVNATLAAGMFIFVFLRAFQQRNVAHLNYKWVMPTSLGMGFVEYSVIIGVLKQIPNGWELSTDFLFPILSVGVGGGLGCLLSMYLHKRYVT